MRRLLPALLVAALLAFAGCGGATDTDDPDENSNPLKVQHALGVSKVPGRAERPVTLYPSELDSSLALGTQPVGAAGPIPRYLGARGRRVASVGTLEQPDLGRIRSLDPDLILASKPSHKRLYKRLKKIAPTVVLTEGIDWKANFRQDGEALGYADRAERLLTRYDRRAADVRRLARDRRPPELPPTIEGSLQRIFIASILKDVGIGSAFAIEKVGPPEARPGPLDHWTLGEGYLAAMAVLDDLEHLYR